MKKIEGIQWQYLITVEHRREYLGLRFFKWSIHSDTVIQIVKTSGEMKRGRGNLYGVYLISRQTLFSNYVALAYAVPCSKREFQNAFKQVVENLA